MKIYHKIVFHYRIMFKCIRRITNSFIFSRQSLEKLIRFGSCQANQKSSQQIQNILQKQNVSRAERKDRKNRNL